MSCSAISPISGTVCVKPNPCEDGLSGSFARMEAELDNFFNKITNIGNNVMNLDKELKRIVDILSLNSRGLINSILGSLQDKLSELISGGIKNLQSFLLNEGLGVPKIIEKILPLSDKEGNGFIKNLIKGIHCLAAKLSKATFNVFEDLIKESVKNVLNAGSCVFEQLMSAFTSKLNELIDTFVSPLLDPIKNILGKFFDFNLQSFLKQGFQIIRKIQNLLECDESKICPASTKYILDKGDEKSNDSDQKTSSIQRIFEGAAKPKPLSAAVGNLASDFQRDYGNWSIFGSPLSEASDIGPCKFGNFTRCGSPKVEFFGGGGSGAAGNVILGGIVDKFDTEDLLGTAEQFVGNVKRVGGVVGVEITSPGSGYKNAPLISFKDSCNSGRGAFGRAIIETNPKSPNYGKVTGVIISNSGENYPADIEEDVLYIKDILIEDPGENYDDNDTIEGLDLTISGGKILKATPQNFGYNGLPNLNINSNTGYGAILRPVMSIVPPQIEVIKVIDCVRS